MLFPSHPLVTFLRGGRLLGQGIELLYCVKVKISIIALTTNHTERMSWICNLGISSHLSFDRHIVKIRKIKPIRRLVPSA